MEGFIQSKVKVVIGEMKRIVWTILCGVGSWRRGIICRWICRAEYKYLHTQSVGLCVCFAETRPWWLPRCLSAGDVIVDFSRGVMTSLYPVSGRSTDGYTIPRSVDPDGLKNTYWWPPSDRHSRMKALAHLKEIYSECSYFA